MTCDFRSYAKTEAAMDSLAKLLTGRSRRYATEFNLAASIKTAGSLTELLAMVGSHTQTRQLVPINVFQDTVAIEDAVAMDIMDRAELNGRTDVYNVKLVCGYPEPVASFLARGYTRSIRRFLENGFDPRAPIGPEGVVPLEHAKDYGTAAGMELLHSFLARQQVERILDAAAINQAAGGRAP